MKFLYTILLFCFALLSESQAQELVASISKTTAAAGEQLKLSYKIDAKADNFRAPNLSSFRVFSGPNSSSSMKWVNGVVSNSTSISYIIAAKSEGKFTIPAASIQFNGNSYTSNSLEINVVSAQQKQQQSTSNSGSQSSGTSAPNTGNEMDKNVFLRVQLSNSSPFEGEQIVATYKLYYRIDVINIEADKLPSYKGFSSYDVQLKNNNLPQEIVGGNRYNVAAVQQVVLYPQRAGELIVDALKLKTIVRVATQRRARSIFDQFFGSYQDLEHLCESQKLKIKVKALPSKGKPASFSGAVGNYKYQTSIDRDSLGANDALNLKAEISGKGDLQLLPEPEFKFPADFEVYDPKSGLSTNVNSTGITGKKSYEYLVIPRHSGIFEIEAKAFSYFDPVNEKYVEIPAKTYEIRVGKVDAESLTSFRASKKEDIKFVGKDIRYINTENTELSETDDVFFRSVGFWVILFIAPLLSILLQLLIRNFEKSGQDIKALKRRKAAGVAAKHLKQAEKALKENSDKVYEEISIALNGYLADKLAIPNAELSRERILEELLAKKLSPDDCKELEDLLAHCDMARFAPGGKTDRQRLFERSKEVINRLENNLS